MTYENALNKFVETIRVNSLEYYKKTGLTHLVDNPEVIKVNKGRRFDKVVRGTSVYCFVEKETGFISVSLWLPSQKGWFELLPHLHQ